MPNFVHLDFETKSACNLREKGAAAYAEDPTTDILCCAMSNYTSEPDLFTPDDLVGQWSDLITEEIETKINDGTIFVAHNAGFEILIWREIMVKRYGMKDIPLEQWKCTMAKCHMHGLPGGLEEAGLWLGLQQQKDTEGSKIMKRLSQPHTQKCFDGLLKTCNCNKKPSNQVRFMTEREEPESFQKLYSYCKQDVRSEMELDSSLRDLNENQQRTWQIYMQMNLEGFLLDVPTIIKACEFIEAQKKIDNDAMALATDGMVSKPTQRKKLKQFLNESCDVETPDTKKATMLKLSRIEGLPDWVMEVIELGKAGNKTSLAKYPKMLTRCNAEGVLREYVLFHGTHTSRPTGKGVQLLNLARPKWKADAVPRAISNASFDEFQFLYEDKVAEAISYGTRGMLIARPGRKLLMADYSQIEAKTLPWLAGEERSLDIFRAGKDIYCDFGSELFGRAISKSDDLERQTAKMAVLGLGFGGGIGAFATTSLINDLDLMVVYEILKDTFTDDEISKFEWVSSRYYFPRAVDPVCREAAMVADVIKQRWRLANPAIVEFWTQLEESAILAMKKPGERIVMKMPYCELVWCRKGKFLFCKRPGGNLQAYFKPKLVSKNCQKQNPRLKDLYEIHYSTVRGRRSLYGGKIAENITQGTAHDVTENAILNLPVGYDLRLDVYDELVVEVDENYGSLDVLIDTMLALPEWASGMPVKAEGYEGLRYRK